MFAKHISAAQLKQSLLKKHPQFIHLDYDTLEDLYKNENPIVLTKIYSIRALLALQAKGQLEDMSPLAFLMFLGALSDVPTSFRTLDILVLAPEDLLYGLYQYIEIVGMPRMDLLKAVGVLLIENGVYKVTYKPLQFMNQYILMVAPDKIKYHIEHEKFTQNEQSAIELCMKKLYSMIRSNNEKA